MNRLHTYQITKEVMEKEVNIIKRTLRNDNINLGSRHSIQHKHNKHWSTTPENQMGHFVYSGKETKNIVKYISRIFEETVNSERYLSMLCNNFVLHLLAIGLKLQAQWFMQDGARPHTPNIVLDFLHDTFDSRDITNRFPNCFNVDRTGPE
jgi:hypothetical protein